MSSPKLTLPVALTWIIGSVFALTGSIYSLWTWHLCERESHETEKEPALCHIIQTGPHTDALPTDFLAQILGLSRDHPTSLAHFNEELATERLQQMPMVKNGRVSSLDRDTLYIDYTMRQPMAKIYDYENIAVDEEGFLFPVSPFFSPKDLPEFYFGFVHESSSIFSFQKPLDGEKWKLAVTLLKILQDKTREMRLRIQRIDVAHAFEKSLGGQEIVIEIASEEEDSGKAFVHSLRLHPLHYEQQLGNYFMLYSTLLTENGDHKKVIDLRVEGLAFVR